MTCSAHRRSSPRPSSFHPSPTPRGDRGFGGRNLPHPPPQRVRCFMILEGVRNVREEVEVLHGSSA